MSEGTPQRISTPRACGSNQCGVACVIKFITAPGWGLPFMVWQRGFRAGWPWLRRSVLTWLRRDFVNHA
jgi:hypothetical protein